MFSPGAVPAFAARTVIPAVSSGRQGHIRVGYVRAYATAPPCWYPHRLEPRPAQWHSDMCKANKPPDVVETRTRRRSKYVVVLLRARSHILGIAKSRSSRCVLCVCGEIHTMARRISSMSGSWRDRSHRSSGHRPNGAEPMMGIL